MNHGIFHMCLCWLLARSNAAEPKKTTWPFWRRTAVISAKADANVIRWWTAVNSCCAALSSAVFWCSTVHDTIVTPPGEAVIWQTDHRSIAQYLISIRSIEKYDLYNMLNSLICNNMYKDMWAQFQTKRMTGLPHLLSLFSFRSTSGFVFVQPHFPALELGPRFGPLFTTSVAKDKPIWPFQKCSNMFQRFSEMRMLQVVPQWFQLVPIGSTVVPIGSNWFQLVPIGSNWFQLLIQMFC